jgi:type II secretion system protein H
MAISATGNKRLAPDAGVSLVEAMVALLIVSLVVGVVMLLAPGTDRHARLAAEQLAARIALASEESVIVNRSLSLIVTEEGYGFERLEDNGWFPAEQRSPLGFRAWDADLQVRVEPAADDPRVARFDPLGGATATNIILDQAGARWRVRLNEAGEVDVQRVE